MLLASNVEGNEAIEKGILVLTLLHVKYIMMEIIFHHIETIDGKILDPLLTVKIYSFNWNKIY